MKKIATTTEITDVKDETRIRMVDATFRITLENLSYAEVDNIARYLKDQNALFRKTAIDAADKSAAMEDASLGKPLMEAAEACDKLATRFARLHKAFDVQLAIDRDNLAIGRSFKQS